MTRKEVLGRYRHLRAISTQHHSAALKFLARSTILEHARRLGLAKGKALLVQNEAELTLVFDLAIYTARAGHSRAIDRYAQATQLPEGSDEALMLEVMRRARFSVWQVKGRHDTAGLVVTDLLRKVEAWLVDERLEATAQDGMAFAARLYDLDRFAMTAGVVVPVDRELLDEILTDSLRPCGTLNRLAWPMIHTSPLPSTAPLSTRASWTRSCSNDGLGAAAWSFC